LFHLLLREVGNQLDECQQELSLLCLQLGADTFQLGHGSLVLKVLEMSVELKDVYPLVELSNSLLLCFKLVDVKLATLEQ